MRKILDGLKESTTVIPYLGGYFVLYGALSCITYYWMFNVDILQYIDFSEIIIYFIKDLGFILANILLMGTVLLLYNPIKKTRLFHSTLPVKFYLDLKKVPKELRQRLVKLRKLKKALDEEQDPTEKLIKETAFLAELEEAEKQMEDEGKLTKKLNWITNGLRVILYSTYAGTAAGSIILLGWFTGILFAMPCIVSRPISKPS